MDDLAEISKSDIIDPSSMAIENKTITGHFNVSLADEKLHVKCCSVKSGDDLQKHVPCNDFSKTFLLPSTEITTSRVFQSETTIPSASTSSRLATVHHQETGKDESNAFPLFLDLKVSI